MLQWQPDPDVVMDPEIVVLKEVAEQERPNPKGEFPRHADPQWRPVPLGYWGWKWNTCRMNYSVWEQELMAGLLVLAGQAQMLRFASRICWLSDQAAVAGFCDGPPPTNPRRLRWWSFLQSLPLTTFHLAGVHNEWLDFRYREEFGKWLGQELLERAQDTVVKVLDKGLDLSMDW